MKHSALSVHRLVLLSLLAAMQIILSRYLAIQVSDTLRISFETVPLALAGIWLGPASGVLMALVSDILGTVIYGYGVYFPPIALGPVVFTLLCALGVRRIFPRDLSGKRFPWGMFFTVVLAGLINAFGVGLVTTTWYQMIISGVEGSFPVLASANFLSRLTTKPFTVLASALLVCLINRAVYPLIRTSLCTAASRKSCPGKD